ncbi:hypothetical protein GM3708_251 [Geminocystis sp. NIES-3708]|uniref:PEP-CTERM sorting domain-containing protein n=1 Tax=Geminocystis sp. NIES-3708 TaxID=1615909 RepID=UPI0005FCA636|nr:PEP-CTERM sorting domain-containing protein [Geminocystis sp. NIES-3708]BAQ59845.1 hypothetical protein GM3708_251 [Geminocystis sp. NIES-3708]
MNNFLCLSLIPLGKKSFKTIASSSLALGMATVASLAGSTLLAPGAQALTLWDFKQAPIILGDKQFTYIFSDNIDDGATIDVSSSGQDYIFSLDLLGANRNVAAFKLDYDVQVLDPKYVIAEVDLDSTVNSFAPNEVLTTDFNATQLVSTNGSADIGGIVPRSAVVAVRNDYVSNGGTIFSFQNSFHQVEVPEPLTILGTGIALGFGGLFKSKSSKKQSAEA